MGHKDYFIYNGFLQGEKMIILQTGVPGSGKTSNIISILMSDQSYTHFTDKDGVKKQRPLFVNGINDLKIQHQELLDEQIKNQPLQDFLPYGSLVIIDEAQRLMGTRSAASKVPDYIEALATHRHHGLDIVLITQHPSFLDPFVRKLVQRHMHISIKAVGRKLYEWNECVDQPDSKTNIDRAIERQFSVPKKAFDMYKSAEVHTKVNRRIPKSLIFLILFLPALVYFSYSTYSKMRDKYSNDEQTAQQMPAEDTVPNHQIDSSNNNQAVKSLEPIMFKPTIPEKPESKPIYDSVRQVKTFEKVVACVKSSKKSCNCYTEQATKIPEIPFDLCLKYVKDGLPFDPYREQTQYHQLQEELPDEQTELFIENNTDAVEVAQIKK